MCEIDRIYIEGKVVYASNNLKTRIGTIYSMDIHELHFHSSLALSGYPIGSN